MAKYIVDLPDTYASKSALLGDILAIPIILEGGKCYKIPTGIKLEPCAPSNEDEIREKAHEEAWDFMYELFFEEYSELDDCFGTESRTEIMSSMTYSEAKARYEEWRKQKEKIRVGDEVTAKTDTDKDMPKGIVTYNNPEQSQFLVIKSDGTFSWWHKGGLRKTGRHFDEVEKLMKRMREE